jgi:ABC-type multidrug transport system permease subunit
VERDRGGAQHPLVELTLVRVREFLREPEALFWTFIFPVVLSLALGIAFPGSGSPTVVVGLPAGAISTTEHQALAAAPGVEVRVLESDAELPALREGAVHIVVHPGNPPEYRYDPSRDESRAARLVVDDVLKRSAGRTDPWVAREDRVEIPGSRYVDWLIPGIIGMNVMGSSLWGLGFSIVQMRMRRILKRLVASPMKRWEFLLAQVLARVVFLLPEVAVPLAFGVLAFGMPILGSVWAIAVVSMVGALGFSGFGLLLASRPKTIEAISGVMNLAMVPMWILSGIFFSAANFPDSLQWFIQALPLTALIDALRAIILEGASLAAVSHEVAVLVLWGVVPFALALRVFRWR